MTYSHDHAFPVGLAGISLWLDASNLSAANSLWNDLSGNNNHASKNGNPSVISNSVNGSFR